ncbi:type II toxin-antitoxin system Phd/YefM family antitoxin [uncultured Marinobacter sp.]|uniref:type II toxin-antitoxin system Phd/YefM family antitoxin n=1 Tax=uncultured Marinobacter sp. TaxID=187379 RepID=UPI0030DBC986
MPRVMPSEAANAEGAMTNDKGTCEVREMKSLFARLAATISELKANPNEVLNQANGEPVVILSHNKPRAYMVPVETFEQMQEQLEDYRLLLEARKRMDDESIPVTINELRAGIQEKSAQGVEQA